MTRLQPPNAADQIRKNTEAMRLVMRHADAVVVAAKEFMEYADPLPPRGVERSLFLTTAISRYERVRSVERASVETHASLTEDEKTLGPSNPTPESAAPS